jgi:hypothetical protein
MNKHATTSLTSLSLSSARDKHQHPFVKNMRERERETEDEAKIAPSTIIFAFMLNPQITTKQTSKQISPRPFFLMICYRGKCCSWRYYPYCALNLFFRGQVFNLHKRKTDKRDRHKDRHRDRQADNRDRKGQTGGQQGQTGTDRWTKATDRG